MEQVDMPGQLSNWKFVCFASRETIRQGNKQGRNSDQKSGSGFGASLGTCHLPQECQGPNIPEFGGIMGTINLAALC
jgi:hypothetical protein